MKRLAALASALAALAIPVAAHAQTAVPGALDRAFGELGGAGGEPLSLSLQLLLIMGLLTILPALILMMTSFTRILVVLAILRQALGLQQSPPNQALIGLSLFLSLFVMAPTLERVNDTAIAPYSAGTINAEQAIQALRERDAEPLHLAAHRLAVCRLRHEVEVVRLDREVDDLEVLVVLLLHQREHQLADPLRA